MLKVISRSPLTCSQCSIDGRSAVRLCKAERAYIFRYDGEVLRAAASLMPDRSTRTKSIEIQFGSGGQRIGARRSERRTVQVADVQADPDYNYVARDGGLVRTTLAVPMLKGDKLIGTSDISIDLR